MKRIEKMETPHLIDLFIQTAQGYEKAIERGAVKEANRNTSTGDRVVRELKMRGAERELLTLLDHPLLIVRAKAAAYALRFAPDAAVPVLEDLSENSYGTPSVQAFTMLMVWKEENNNN